MRAPTLTLDTVPAQSESAQKTFIGSLQVTRLALEAHGVLSIRVEPADGKELPAWKAGAHLDLELPSGLLRQYSLCGDPADHTSYTIAVLLDEQGRGGSAELHHSVRVGDMLKARALRNHFELIDAPSYLLIAGGIGITPMLAMARKLVHGVAPWKLHYVGRARTHMAFTRELATFADRVHIHPRAENGPIDVDALITETAPDTAVYCCGPDALMKAVERACASATPPRSFHMERFGSDTTAPPPNHKLAADDPPFTVTLRRTGVELPVANDRSVLEVVREAVPEVGFSCEEGYCGSCETRVLMGIPDHRDDVLSSEERAANDTMMICVSRARSQNLVLDL